MKPATPDPPPIRTRDQVRELDRRAIEEFGIPSTVLMENAGRACADHAAELAPDPARPVLVLCGPGNNGGDGFVVARTLANRGRAALAVFVGSAEQLARGSGDARLMAELWERLGGATRVVGTAAEVRALAPDLARSQLVVDALFGTGLTRALASPWDDAVELLNTSGARVLAVDVPSGLDADTGAILGACVRATRTVSFVAYKPGFFAAGGPSHVGELVLAEIGVPCTLLREDGQSPPPSK